MAVDMFLKLDGIDGESVDKSHGKEIDILAWSWGMSQSGTFHAGAGGGAGKANFQDISVTKWVDKASATLMAKIATGEHIPKARLTVRKAGKTPLEYVIIDMEKVMITSYSTGGSGGEDRLTENITLNFAKVKVKYVPQKEDGSGDAEIEFGFDIAANITA
ncbi:MAG: type VI secretion system tube protein Hcp [Alteromonadaceae bacterium]|nr:type VI secretion system tube protein Hcp [Alteromonadaceae bacterium]